MILWNIEGFQRSKLKKDRHKIYISIGANSCYEKINPLGSNFPDAFNIFC